MSSIYLDLSNFKNKLQLDREDHLAESVVSLTDKQKLSLYKKSQKSGYSTDILEEVYRRGHLIWKPELFEGTREQFAFDRVNSFISGGFAADLDTDLLDEGKGLWANIHAKRERIKAGSGERMRKPGEKGAPTKEAIRSAQNEDFELLELEESAALAKKAKASGVSLGILKKVYARGVAAWRTGHRPGTTPQQWGMARVNSYITKGKGTYHGADKDLREARLPEVPKDKETGLPKKYTTGEKGTDRARAAHFAKGREKHWDDPSAYEKAPGDATAKTKESKHTKKYRQMYGEELQLEAKKLRKDPWDKMTKHLPHLKASQERAEAAVAGLKQAAQDYQAILDKEKGVKKEEYTGSEKVSSNSNDASSRFIGTKSLTGVYKKDTPGEVRESSLSVIKRIIAESTVAVPPKQPISQPYASVIPDSIAKAAEIYKANQNQDTGAVYFANQKREAESSNPLMKVGTTTSNLKTGSSGDDVSYIQKQLGDLYKGSVDGKFGNLTKEAVLAYQKNNNLKQDGIVGDETLSHMKQQEALQKLRSENPTGAKYFDTDVAKGPRAAPSPVPVIRQASGMTPELLAPYERDNNISRSLDNNNSNAQVATDKPVTTPPVSSIDQNSQDTFMFPNQNYGNMTVQQLQLLAQSRSLTRGDAIKELKRRGLMK